MCTNEDVVSFEVIAKGDSGDRSYYWNAIGSKAEVFVNVNNFDLYQTLVGAAVIEDLLVDEY